MTLPRSDLQAVSISKFWSDGLSLKLEGSRIIFSSRSISSAGMSPVINALTATDTLSGSVDSVGNVSRVEMTGRRPVEAA